MAFNVTLVKNGNEFAVKGLIDGDMPDGEYNIMGHRVPDGAQGFQVIGIDAAWASSTHGVEVDRAAQQTINALTAQLAAAAQVIATGQATPDGPGANA